jgi:uncharacterized protein involved in exopolysaccharide biosynthesis
VKIRHRIPVEQLMKSDLITPEYQAEVDATMARAETAYRQAERRLAQEEKRLERLRKRVLTKTATRKIRRQIQEAEALVELRRLHLRDIHRLLTAAPQSAQHRGKKNHRHVPSPEVL